MIRPEGHEAACPCNLCVAFDVAYAAQEGSFDLSVYRPGGLEGLIKMHRERRLNWDLPANHCLICGGTAMFQRFPEHYEIRRYNTQELDGKVYTSWMLHKEGGMIAVYNAYLRQLRPFVPSECAQARTSPRARFIEWVCTNLRCSPEKFIGLATRDTGDWIEIRFGFTELVNEDYDARTERRRRADESTRIAESADRNARGIQELASLARSPIAVPSSMSGRVYKLEQRPADTSPNHSAGGS